VGHAVTRLSDSSIMSLQWRFFGRKNACLPPKQCAQNSHSVRRTVLIVSLNRGPDLPLTNRPRKLLSDAFVLGQNSSGAWRGVRWEGFSLGERGMPKSEVIGEPGGPNERSVAFCAAKPASAPIVTIRVSAWTPRESVSRLRT